MMTKLAAAIVGLLLSTVVVAGLPLTTVYAEPKLTEQDPAYGDAIETLPEFFHLCFSEPVKVESPDWKFNVRTPDGGALGLRIVFMPSGDCVDVYPGASEDPPQGIWTFDWLVRSQADDAEGSGAVSFQLGDLQPGETPLKKPDSGGTTNSDGDGGGTSIGLFVAIGAGAALIIAGGAGFVFSRRRRT